MSAFLEMKNNIEIILLNYLYLGTLLKMPCTPAQLAKAARWREKHKEQDRIIHLTYYENNKEKENNRVMKYYQFKKECQRLREILLH
jgi:hypothetical protein